jgi:S-DNA-T family DNA segregation ATPase FtsK/SpoIIIE
LTIKVLSGPDQGKVFTPDKGRVEIGRLPTCDVRLSDAGISRLHATIRLDGGRYVIYDENSANGIEMPATRGKLAFAELCDGMVLRLSDTEIEVRVSSVRGAASHRSQAAGPN